MRVLHALHKGKMAAHDRFRPFLMAPTRRAAVEQLRKAGRRRPAEDAELAAAWNPPAPDHDPDRHHPGPWSRRSRSRR